MGSSSRAGLSAIAPASPDSTPGVEDVDRLRAYLEGAGYCPMPAGHWPPGVIAGYANEEGDRVLVVRNRLGYLELRPLDSESRTAAPASSSQGA